MSDQRQEQAAPHHHAPTTEEAIKARQEEVAGHVSHGHSKAAWTGVCVCLAGALAGSFALVFGVSWLVVTGLVVMALSGPITMAMSKAGYGQKQHPRDEQEGKPTPVR